MTITDEVGKLQREGKSEKEIVAELRGKGISGRDAVDAISQGRIKEAVFSKGNGEEQNNQGDLQEEQAALEMPPVPSPIGLGEPQTTMEYSDQSYNGEYSGMQPSMLTQEPEAYPESEVQQGYGGEVYPPGGYQESYSADFYPQYQPYQEAMSSDIITEISEQVVSEKLAALHDRLEKVMDIRTVMEARISSLNERLKRIEKIMDQVQLSLLQKVGEYVTDVKDMKKELEETHKSFSALHKRKSSEHHKRKQKK